MGNKGEEMPEAPAVRYLIGKSAGRSGLITGIIATHVATVSGLWFAGSRLPKFDFNTLNGYLYLGLTYGFTHPAEAFVIGGVIHYINGILWGLIFALVIHPTLGKWVKGLAPMTPTINYLKGLLWGWALWIISSAAWMPLVVGSLGIPVGPFLTSFGTVGVQAVFTNLLWHTIYGLNLGLLFNPTPVRMSTSGAMPGPAAASAMAGAEPSGG
jgi:hypothetical protein